MIRPLFGASMLAIVSGVGQAADCPGSGCGASLTPRAVAAMLGGHPALLDADGSLSASKAAAAADAVQRTLSAHFSDIVNAADYGIDCDAGITIAFSGSANSTTLTSRHYVFGPADIGRHIKGAYAAGSWRAVVTGFRPAAGGVSSATVSAAPPHDVTGDAGVATYVDDNSDAMDRVYHAYLAQPKGALVSWPAGVCDFSRTQHWRVPAPLRFSGMGIGATKFQLTRADIDAFVFDVGPHADITLDSFTLGKQDFNQPFAQAARFANKALAVHGSVSTDGGADDSGLLVADHILIEGSSKDSSGPGWQVGFEATSWARPIISYVNVDNAGIADGWNGAYSRAPNPIGSPTAPIPPGIAPGQGDDFWIHGVPNDAGRVGRDAAAGETTLSLDQAGPALHAGDGVEDVNAKQSLGMVHSVRGADTILDAASAASPAGRGATRLRLVPNEPHAHLLSGTITDVTTGRRLGIGKVSGLSVEFETAVGSAVGEHDLLSSGIEAAARAGDALANNTSYAIDTVFSNDTANGGNVGLELTDFQGAYVSNFDAVYGGTEIRAGEDNDSNNLPELLEITNSLLNGFVMDIDVAYVGGVGISNNNIIHSFKAPFFVGVWNHGGAQWNITGNQFDAPFQNNASAIVFSSGRAGRLCGISRQHRRQQFLRVQRDLRSQR